jgi:hypothetical protein
VGSALTVREKETLARRARDLDSDRPRPSLGQLDRGVFGGLLVGSIAN